MAWLSGYAYRKPLVITGGASGAQINFQLDIDIAYVAAKMQADFDDIRFTQNNGTTLIDAWLESKVDSTSAETWAEFPTTPANTVEQTYYMYYGKVVANYWDIGATFVLGDDFPGTSLDTNKWSGTATVSGSKVTVGGSNARIDSILNFGYGYAVVGYGKVVQSGLCSIGFGAENADANATCIYQFGTGGALHAISRASGSSSGGVSTGDTEDYTYKRWECRRLSSILNEYRIDALSVVNRTTNIPTGDLSTTLYTLNAADSVEFDWVFVRKHVSGPPTYAFGAEESAPTAGVRPPRVFYGPFAGPFGGPI